MFIRNGNVSEAATSHVGSKLDAGSHDGSFLRDSGSSPVGMAEPYGRKFPVKQFDSAGTWARIRSERGAPGPKKFGASQKRGHLGVLTCEWGAGIKNRFYDQ
ncbi:MAG: hypothetical protein FJ308_21070 [Planctomycetes bacterium]|nr:hypothetical protein [Planctomycetota bacterium]